jgi:simple sugar transport system ATP-binding protein
MSEPFLTLKQVSKQYAGVSALDNVDFEIERGEIHCLVGENGSGKSTMIKVISGTVKPTPGSIIEVEGQLVHNYKEIDAIDKGIEVIYQDLSLFPNLTVAENIAIGQFIASHKKLINWKELRWVAEKAMEQIDVHLTFDAIVSEVSIADQQLVAICRAMTQDVKLLIMDEPTASLAKHEVDSLISVVMGMKNKGITIMFVSHKLNEVLQIADRVSVIRDGKMVGVYQSNELTNDKLTMLMTGKKVKYKLFTAPENNLEPILECRHLSRKGQYKDINLKSFPGEILGITGLLGSGRTELALTLFGVNQPDSGEIIYDGVPVKFYSIQNAIEHGIGYVPEDRLVKGLIYNQSVGKNIIITTLDNLVNRVKLLNQSKVKDSINRWVKNLSIRTPSIESPIQTLSGGNQQRVVLAKWISTQPRILILDGPTTGIDIVAKHAIHEIIRKLASQGIAIILISDEISEVCNNCNRILVMRKGIIVREFDASHVAQEEIQNYVNATNSTEERML